MKFLYGFLAFLAVIAAALFLVPLFLDWEQFKPEITERLEAITGRALAIDGPVDVSILPTPTIKASDVRVANAAGAAAPDIAQIKAFDLRLALGPLLGGEIAVTSLMLDEPFIEFQRLADGSPNWLFERAPDPAKEEAAAEEAEAGLELTKLDFASITNGTVVYRGADGQLAETIEGIDATLSARSLDGPFRGDGTFNVRGRPVAFQFATSTMREDRTLPVSLEAKLGGERGSVLFEGTLQGNDGIPAFDGNVKAESADFAALLNALAVDLGSLPAAPFAAELSAKAALSVSADTIEARALQLRLGESQASGALSWHDGDTTQLGAKIDVNRIDLDAFFLTEGKSEAEAMAGSNGAENPGDTPAKPLGDAATPPADAAALAFLRTISDDIRRIIPGDLAATVDLAIGTLIWREGVIRQTKTILALKEGAVSTIRASALLPGGADLDLAARVIAAGGNPWLTGVAEMGAENLRAVLAWLGVDVGAVPADRLRRLSASLDLSAGDDRLSASDFDIRVDTTRIAGNAFVEAGMRPRLTADIAVDAVNIDAYLRAANTAAAPDSGNTAALETRGEDAASQNAPQTAQAAPGGADVDIRDVLDEIDADVRVTMDALTYGGIRLAGLDLDAALAGSDLTVRRAAVADAAGANVSIAGTARRVWSAPTVDLTVEGAADSLDGVTALFDIDSDIRTEAFGKVSLQGELAGDEDALSLNLGLTGRGSEMVLAGTIERPFGEPAAALSLRLQASNADALARTAGLTPPPVVTRLGALAIDGGIGGDFDSVAINLIAETADATVLVGGKIMHPLTEPDYSVDVDLAHPQAEALIETVIGEASTDATLGPLRIAGVVSGDLTKADFTGIDAAVGESSVTGEASLRLDREPPAFHADLRAGMLDLEWLGGVLAATSEATGGGVQSLAVDRTDLGIDGATGEPERWSDEAIDLAALDRLDGTLALAADALVLGTYRIEQASIDLAAADGALTLRSLHGRLFEGALEADGSLTGAPVPAAQAAFRLGDADLSAILRDVGGGRAVSGNATIDGYFTLRGETAREMVQSLAGRVAITSREGAVEGVDVPAISGQIAALSQVDALDDIATFVEEAERSLSDGRTAIHSLDGTIRVQNGLARIDGLEIVADGGTGEVEGTADLPAWELDLTALFRLADHADAPPVGVKLEGSIDRPERRYLIEDMQAHLIRLGLLSLAGTQNVPKITLRKGAKAEPGTEMDTLLRNVLGDPDKVEEGEEAAGAEPAEGVEDAAQAEEPAQQEQTEALEPAERTGEPEPAGQTEEPATAGHPLEPQVTLSSEAEAVAEDTEEPGKPDTHADGESESAPAAEGVAPEPPSAPERDGGENLQDFVDDLLKVLEE